MQLGVLFVRIERRYARLVLNAHVHVSVRTAAREVEQRLHVRQTAVQRLVGGGRSEHLTARLIVGEIEQAVLRQRRLLGGRWICDGRLLGGQTLSIAKEVGDRFRC